jgi:uncharacterized protein YcfJ
VKHALLSMMVVVPLLSGCARDSYGRTNAGNRAMIGAVAGGALGALAGQAFGVNPVTGAAAGMALGGAAGALIKGPVLHGRQYYRDSRGYCYYIDASGNAKYEPSVRC